MERLEIIGLVSAEPRTVVIGDRKYVSLALSVRRGENETSWYEALLEESHYFNALQHIVKGARIWCAGRPRYSTYLSRKDSQIRVSVSVFVNELEITRFADGQVQDGQEGAKPAAKTIPEEARPDAVRPEQTATDTLPF